MRRALTGLGVEPAGPWRRAHVRRLCRRHEPGANHFGYSLLDPGRADPFPVGSAFTR